MKAEFLARRCALLLGFAMAAAVSMDPCQLQAQVGLPVARLTAVFPPGGQRGSTFEVTITGTDLDEAKKLQFSDPGISAVPKTTEAGLGQTGPQPVANQFLVTVKPDAKAGVHEVRAVGRFGISSPRAFVVGAVPEFTETEPNNALAQATQITVNSTVNGRSNQAADLDYFKFTAKKGQRLTLDCLAYRIDSHIDATLALFDASGAELARNRDTNRIDPLLDVVIPADGEYYAEVYDFLYAGGNDYFYRLTVSAAPYIDFVLPPAGQAGTTGKFTVYGYNLPGGHLSPVMVSGKPLEMLDVQIQLPGNAAHELGWTSDVELDESGLDGIEYHLDSPQGPSNSVVLGIATAPVIAEQEPNDAPDKAQKLTTPCEIYGQFNPRRDQDWFTFEAKKGDVFWIEVFSERLAEPTDPFLLVQSVTKDAQGKETVKDLQAMDDAALIPKGQAMLDIATEDPSYRFTAPADGTVRVLVRNLYYTATGDPRHLYRLAIHPPQPDFRLVAVPRTTPTGTDAKGLKPDVESLVLRRGGAAIVDLYVHRREGFDGEIQITAAGLPGGVAASPLTISANSSNAELVVQAADNAPEFNGALEIVGTAKIDAKDVTRRARSATVVWVATKQQDTSPPRARLARTLPLAVLGEQAPYTLDVGQNPVIEISRAGKTKLPVKIARRGDFKDKLALQPFGLPKDITAPAGTIDAGAAEGSLELTVPATAKPGIHSFSVLGVASVNYARNPESVAAANERKAAVDKIVAERAAAAKVATDAKTAAETKSTQATQALQQATDAQKAAVKSLADADAAVKAAADQVKAAQDAATKDASNQGLTEAKKAAEGRATEATAKAKAAADAKTAADKALADATAAAKVATDAKTAATAAATAATAGATAATTFQQSFAATVTDVVNKAKPGKVAYGVSSAGITVKIVDAPITLSLSKHEANGASATKVEVPVTIKRLPDFKDAVILRVKATDATKGITAAPVTIAAEQNAGTLVIDLAKTAAPGLQKITIEAAAKLNGQELVSPDSISVTVEKAPEPAKK